MWEIHSHSLAPLNQITSSKVNFKWTNIKTYALDEIKGIVARDTLTAYPYFNEEFSIRTDASVFQLGEVIRHKVKPITFYIIKITESPKRYTVIEGGLLSIFGNLKEFRNISLGHRLITYNDHKNLTCNNFNDRVLIWRLILEEYGPDIEYIKSQKIYSGRCTINIALK